MEESWKDLQFLKAVTKVQRFLKMCNCTMESLILAVFKGWLQWEGQVLLLRQAQLQEWARQTPSPLTKKSIWMDFLPFLIPRSLKLQCTKQFCATHFTQMGLHDRQRLRKELCNGSIPLPFVRVLHEDAIHRDYSEWIHCLERDEAEVYTSLNQLLHGIPEHLWQQGLQEWALELSVEVELFHSPQARSFGKGQTPHCLLNEISTLSEQGSRKYPVTSDLFIEPGRMEFGLTESEMEGNCDFIKGEWTSEGDEDQDLPVIFAAAPPSLHFCSHQPARRAVAMELLQQHSTFNVVQESCASNIRGFVDRTRESCRNQRASRKFPTGIPNKPVVRHLTLEELQDVYAQKSWLSAPDRHRRAFCSSRIPPRSVHTLRQEDKQMKPSTIRKYAPAFGSRVARSPHPLDSNYSSPTFSSTKKKGLPVYSRPPLLKHDFEDGLNSCKEMEINANRKKAATLVPSLERNGLGIPPPNKSHPQCAWAASENAKEVAWCRAIVSLHQLAPVDIPVEHSTTFEKKFTSHFERLSALAAT
eukprot:GGOE01037949.1.p1 GENE.GGOE01037949.1~~GGOE01037949.1.p1  ORF type:complete len:538 (+),score=22.59 GGOE01037949.1:29-1615(+)